MVEIVTAQRSAAVEVVVNISRNDSVKQLKCFYRNQATVNALIERYKANGLRDGEEVRCIQLS